MAVAALVAALAAAGRVAMVVHATEAQPLPFEPFRFTPLERSFLAGKFQFLEGAGRLMGRSAEVILDERELNAVLFGEREGADDAERAVPNQQTPENRARVLLQGDRLVIESSRQAEEPGRWKNVRATARVALGPGGLLTLDLEDVQLGDTRLEAPLRALVQLALRRAVAREVAANPRLRSVNAAWVEQGRFHLVYQPQ